MTFALEVQRCARGSYNAGGYRITMIFFTRASGMKLVSICFHCSMEDVTTVSGIPTTTCTDHNGKNFRWNICYWAKNTISNDMTIISLQADTIPTKYVYRKKDLGMCDELFSSNMKIFITNCEWDENNSSIGEIFFIKPLVTDACWVGHFLRRTGQFCVELCIFVSNHGWVFFVHQTSVLILN